MKAGKNISSIFIVFSLLVLSIPANAEILTEFAYFDSVSLQSPTAVALDDSEHLYVSEPSRNRIHVYDSMRNKKQTLYDGLNNPISLAVGSDGRLFVGNAGSGNVSVYDSSLTFQFKLGTGDGEFLHPAAIAVSSSGSIYVADFKRHFIKVFNSDGSYNFTIGSPGHDPGEFNKPVALAIDELSGETDELYVIDMPITVLGGQYGFPHEGARIQVFSLAGQLDRYFGTPGKGDGKLTTPLGISVDSTGRVYITDSGQNIVQVYTKAGGYLGVVYDADHPVRIPVGIAVGLETNRIFVACYSAKKVEIYGPTPTYTVAVTGTAGGTVNQTGSLSVRHGDTLSFSLTPDTGFEISDVLIDTASVGTPESFLLERITADHTVDVTFAKMRFDISAVSDQNGTLDPAGNVSVEYGDNQTFSYTPNEGYHVESLVVDGQPVESVQTGGTYTFSNVIANHTIQTNFAINTYTIIGTTSVGGSISPSGAQSVEYGFDLLFNINPATGYHVSDVVIDGSSIGPVSSHTFTQVQASHSIYAVFEKNSYSVNATAEGCGAIHPSGVVTALYGEDVPFAFSLPDKCEVDDVLLDGVSIGKPDSYTISNIDDNHTLYVKFVSANMAPAAVAGPDQTTTAGATVILSGSNSSDADDVELYYLWEQISGPQVTISGAQTAEASFVAPAVDAGGEALGFRLTVTDSTGEQSQDDCLVNVVLENMPPVASAGPDMTVPENAEVVLDGTGSTDPDADGLTYDWEQVSGIQVQLSATSGKKVGFVAPTIDGQGEFCLFRLTVTDEHGLKSRDYCVVDISKNIQPPVALAGPDRMVQEGDVVTLDSSGSNSSVEGLLGFLWKQTYGIPVIINNRTSSSPSFEAPPVDEDGQELTFLLFVTDVNGLVASDSVTIGVNRTGQSDAEIAPGYVNPKSKGKWIAVFVELPVVYPIEQVDIDTVQLVNVNGVDLDPPLTRSGPSEIGDMNDNGVPDLMVKFNRQELFDLLESGECQVTIRGELFDGMQFEQTFTVDVK